jgi:hypothetical protein
MEFLNLSYDTYKMFIFTSQQFYKSTSFQVTSSQVNILPNYISSSNIFTSHIFTGQHFYKLHFYMLIFLQVIFMSIYMLMSILLSLFIFFHPGSNPLKTKKSKKYNIFLELIFLAPRTCPSSSRRPSRRPRSCEA